jgi:hypothetical protein
VNQASCPKSPGPPHHVPGGCLCRPFVCSMILGATTLGRWFGLAGLSRAGSRRFEDKSPYNHYMNNGSVRNIDGTFKIRNSGNVLGHSIPDKPD